MQRCPLSLALSPPQTLVVLPQLQNVGPSGTESFSSSQNSGKNSGKAGQGPSANQMWLWTLHPQLNYRARRLCGRNLAGGACCVLLG